MSESRKFYHPKSKRSREFQLARMMMVLVMVFLFLNSPRLVLSLVEVTQLSTVEKCYKLGLDFHIYKTTYLLDFTARFLVILNSSINFIIYCMAGSQFRHKLLTILNNVSTHSRKFLPTTKQKTVNLEDGEELTDPITMNFSRKSR